jgi:hypothetical protein
MVACKELFEQVRLKGSEEARRIVAEAVSNPDV